MHKLFQVHILNEQGKDKAKQIARAFDELHTKLSVLCPDGRELSVARTKLEEACFFAKKSMACDSSNTEGEVQP